MKEVPLNQETIQNEESLKQQSGKMPDDLKKMFLSKAKRDLPKMIDIDNYPTYELELPLTRHVLHIRGLTLAEEDKLYSVRGSWERIIENLLKIVYNCITNKEDLDFITWDAFTSKIAWLEFDVLLYGLFMASYGNEVDLAIACPSCNKEFKEHVDLTEIVRVTCYEDEVPALERVHEIELPISKVVVTLKVPTLADFFKVVKSYRDNPGMLNKTINALDVKMLRSKDGLMVDKKIEIATYLDRLPVRDARLLAKERFEFYMKYGIQLINDYECPFCNHYFRQAVNIITELFRYATRQDILQQ